MSIAPPPWMWPLCFGFTRRDANGTLIHTHGRSVEELQPQSNWRLRLGKLCLKLDLLAAPSSDSATAWIAANWTPDRGATQSGDDIAWYFSFSNGFQSLINEPDITYAWAVHAGDVGTAVASVVLIPAAAWLFGSGLLGPCLAVPYRYNDGCSSGARYARRRRESNPHGLAPQSLR